MTQAVFGQVSGKTLQEIDILLSKIISPVVEFEDDIDAMRATAMESMKNNAIDARKKIAGILWFNRNADYSEDEE